MGHGLSYLSLIANACSGKIMGYHLHHHRQQLTHEGTIEVGQRIDAYSQAGLHVSCDRLTPEVAHRSIEPLKKQWKNRREKQVRSKQSLPAAGPYQKITAPAEARNPAWLCAVIRCRGAGNNHCLPRPNINPSNAQPICTRQYAHHSLQCTHAPLIR